MFISQACKMSRKFCPNHRREEGLYMLAVSHCNCNSNKELAWQSIKIKLSPCSVVQDRDIPALAAELPSEDCASSVQMQVLHKAQHKACAPGQECTPWSVLNLGFLAALRGVCPCCRGCMANLKHAVKTWAMRRDSHSSI